MADVNPIMNQMAQAQMSASLAADDPQRSYILKAWVRIGKTMGGDFVPYMPVVMPPLLATIESKLGRELKPEEMDGEDEPDMDSDTECVIQDKDGKFMCITTSVLEEQATACQMVMFLAESLL